MKVKLFTTCFILLALLGFSNLSHANNWYFIAEEGGMEVYWSQDIRLRINQKGNYLQWQMTTITPKSFMEKYFINADNPVRTFIDYLEIDCNLGRHRTIYMETYDGYMGKGNLLIKLDFELLETKKMNAWKYKINDVRDMSVVAFCKQVTNKK